ncbi:uncharacterized protein LOC114865608 isoform X2 [Betta splendens]|uniref:Uncharacterized protein LOC114865608 isoform X2 n=1 Tax=Betta splendens TaxID=158456 RepID=A0A8M1HJX7_BETSP|nr:uncharacterized protein LOC114865608 isoform X2 [Betta splendens]
MEMQKKQQTPEQDALEHIVSCRDKPFLEERLIDSFKGRGVFTQQAIEPSTFVVEYRGKISHLKTRKSRRKHEDTLNNYLYEFSWKGTHWCIDASKEDKTLGRIVNDDHINPNCEMKKLELEGTPHLCLFALREISLGEEITFNYGTSSYPWRSRLVAASCSDEEELGDPKSKRVSDGNYEPEQAASSSDEHGSDGDYKPEEAASSSDVHDSDNDSDNKDTEKPIAVHQSRRNYCYVCGKGMSKISRHLVRHADEEPDIAKVLALPKNSKERKMLLNDLRNRGDYKHNQKVLKTNCGVLKAKRQRRTQTVNGETHTHCQYCKGFISRRLMSNHFSRCPNITANKANILHESDVAESSLSKTPLSDMQKIILSLPSDETSFMVKHDAVLILLTQSLSDKYDGCQEKHEDIKQTLRQMGKFLLALHGRSIFSFKDALKPQNFSKIVETVKSIAGFNEKKGRYKKTGVAITLGQTLKDIANVVVSKAEAEADADEEMVRDTKTFIKLCEEEWKNLSFDKKENLLSPPKVNRPSTIPFTQDVQALYKCLETTSASAIDTVKKYESPQVYTALCRVIVAQVFILNKGACEVSKMTLESFQKREDAAQVLSKHFVQINMPSKTGRNVPVLLTSKLVDALNLLLSKRMTCGVHKDNGFVFAKPDGSPSSFLSGRPCIKMFINLCHAKNPEYLFLAKFQKRITRVFQILNLESDELEHLAKLLGRDICTEKSYYRQPEAAVELAKIAQLLLAMEEGSLERFKGNFLNDIEIADQLEPDEKASSKSDDGAENERCGLFPQWQDVDYPHCELTPEQDALKHIEACKDKPFLEGLFIDHFKGRGVFTHESIEPSTFVLEYRGNVSSQTTQENNDGDTLNNYLFNFSFNGSNWCIDASTDDGTLGRLVNDEHKSPNCEMRKVTHEGKPHLCLFALKKIFAGEEITYNYGDSAYPWRSAESSKKHDVRITAATSPGKEGIDNYSSAESCCDGPDDDPGSDDDCTSNNQSNLKDDSIVAKSQVSGEQSVDDSSVQLEPEGHPFENHSYTRRNYCYVCGKAMSKLSRHLFTHKKEDAEIAAVFALPRCSKERKIQLGKLRSRGNWKHNQEVLKAQHGELKISKRSNATADGKTLTPCLFCKVIYSRLEMWRHLKKCPLRVLSSPSTSNRVLNWVSATVIDSQELSPTVKEMAKTLKGDVTGSVVLTDSYLLHLAEYLCNNIRIKTSTFQYIKSRLRQMGRLLLLLRMKSVRSFEDAMKPQNFSKVVEAVGELTGSSADSESFDQLRAPTLVKSLKLMGNIKYVRALKEDAGEETVREAEAFMALCEKEWKPLPPPEIKIHNAKTKPFIHDVQLLYQLVEKTADSGVQSLTLYETPQVYNALSRVTLAQVSVLNKNLMDISTVTLKSFNQQQDSELRADAAGSSSPLEQILCKRFVKIQLKSRRGKKVPVTLTPKMLSAITLLVKKREACGVHKSNSFLFARPGATASSFYRGQTCIATLVSWSGAKSLSHLKSRFFRKHLARIFQILSLSKDELGQLSNLLGCDICTDTDYYQKPEAAVDIAKILQLISSMEKGTIEEFTGKSLDELELEDELQPEMEQSGPESSDSEDDAAEAESSLQSSNITSKTSISQNEATTSKGLSVRKRGQGRKSKQESGSESSELGDENDDEGNTEDKPVKPPEEAACSKDDATNVWFSDDDEDMNVDFDIDIDTDDDVRNEEHDGDDLSKPVITDMGETKNQTRDTSEGLEDGGSSAEHCPDLAEVMDTDPEDLMDEEDETGVDQTDWMDEKNILEKNKSSAAVSEMKEVKILIPKLQIENVADPIHVSQLSSLFRKWPVKDQVVLHNNRTRKASTSKDTKKKPDNVKDLEMSCSHCKSSMTKGQTAFQKKGFTDVFCSKNCLFEMFPMNKPATKTCHYCLKAVTQMLELVMAVVDTKGTIKDFCSVLCLTSFKSSTVSTLKAQPLCSMCSKACTITHELNINETVHKFCSSSCLEGFRQNCIAVCTNCNSPCLKEVKLKLGDDAKSMCSQRCVREFKENIQTPHPCSRCLTPAPMSSMTVYKSSEDTVELACARPCVTSDQQSHPAVFSKTCYNCFEIISRPQNVILAPVDESGAMRELCSETCLASVKFKRNTAPKALTPRPVGPRSECRMCVRYGHCKFKVTLEGTAYNLCSDSCLVNYYKVNNLPLLTCDLCSSFNFEKRLVLNLENGSKNICSEKCLVKFKEKVQTPQLCWTCQTLHQMSDMVEKEDEKGCLNFFCSYRCMMVYKAPRLTEPEESKPAPQDDDVKEVKPPLPRLDCSKVKEEPDDDDYKQDVLPSLPTQGIKDEPTVAKIGSVLSLKGEPAPEAPTLPHMDAPALCSSCKKVLVNGETVYQKKSQSEIFCSTSCLFRFYQMTKMKTCHFCLQVITQPQDVVQVQLDGDGTVKDFCSRACLSSFNYKTFVSTKVPLVAVGSHSMCSICGRYCISKHEVLQQDIVHKMCSDPCFRRFSNLRKVTVCTNCQSQSSTCLKLTLEDGNKALCPECVAQFKQTQQPCSVCHSSKPVAQMFESRTSDNTVQLFCSSSCVAASKAQSASAAAESSPVITGVVSLAAALAERLRSSSSAQQGSVPDVQTKVVGHACVQTAPREVKNKSTLCTPLVHNKGVCCTTQSVDTEAQTETFTPTVVVLPFPVPVYVPLPMNMYSQYTPQPVGLPLPLPVPVFLPVAPSGSEPTTTTEEIKPEPEQSKRNGGDDGQKDQQKDAQTQTDQPSCGHGVTKETLDTSIIQEVSSSNTSLRSHDGAHAHKNPLGSDLPSASQPELHPQSSQSPAVCLGLKEVHNQKKAPKVQLLSEAAEEDAAPKGVSTSSSRKHQKHHRLKCHRGIDAWKRWVQWRRSQSAGRRRSNAVTLKENILDCSASELNDGLCCFISEVKRPDGEQYSTSSLFYLCLAIQQHLFQNGRTENIFSDLIYNQFSTKFTEILKRFQPAVRAGGSIQSRVEEEFLWECKQLGAYSPIILLNTLLFFCSKYFGFSTVEQHRQLSFAHVMRCSRTGKDNTKVTFLLFKAPGTENQAESDADGVPAKKRKKNEAEGKKLKMMENPENPLRCPVKLYEFYLSKCSESVRQRSDMFYLHPDCSCVPSSPLWFSSAPLDGRVMEAMLVRTLSVREVQCRQRRALGQTSGY